MARTKKSEPHAIIEDCQKRTSALTARQHAIEAQLASPQDGDLDGGADARFRLEAELREIELRLQRLELEKVEAELVIARQTVAHYQEKRSEYWRQKAEAKQRLRDETRERYPKGWRKILAQVTPAWYKQLQKQWHEFFAQEHAVESHLRDLERRRRQLLTPTDGRNDWAHVPLTNEQLNQQSQLMTA